MEHYRAQFDEHPDPYNCGAMLETEEEAAVKETEPHQRKFEWFEKHGHKPAWVFPLRKAGMARFAELGFPTIQDEDWRFTSIAPNVKLPFKPVLEPSRDGLTAEAIANFTFGRLNATRLVFINGHFAPTLSSRPIDHDSLKVKSLADALAEDANFLEQHLGRYAQEPSNSFSALNSAFFQDG